MNTLTPSQELADVNYWANPQPEIEIGWADKARTNIQSQAACQRISEICHRLHDGFDIETIPEGDSLDSMYADTSYLLQIVHDRRIIDPGRFKDEKGIKQAAFDRMARDMVTQPLYGENRVATRVEASDGTSLLIGRTVLYALASKKQRSLIAVPSNEVHNEKPAVEMLSPEITVGQVYGKNGGKKHYKIAQATILKTTTMGRKSHFSLGRDKR